MEGNQKIMVCFFFQNAAFVLGDGRMINFWSDVWCGGEALSNRFRTLFNLATSKEAKVADIWEIIEGEGFWSPTFLRALNDWEIEEMTRFLHILHDQQFRPPVWTSLLCRMSRIEVYR